MTRAIYPGSFDPFHFGHFDIARRASLLFDTLVIAIYDSPSKNLLFSTQERIDLVRQTVHDLPNVEIITYTGLTVDCARDADAQAIVRGLRNIADFQSEHQLAWANNHLASDIDYCCLFCSKEYAYLSSTILKEVAKLDGNYAEWADQSVRTALKQKYQGQINSSTSAEESTSGARSKGKLSYRN